MATFNGTQLNDVLIGGGTDDLLDGLGGADLMMGGLGNDVYILDHGADQVFESAGQGTDTVRSSVAHKLAADVENLELTGVNGLEGTGNTSNNSITGNIGNNTLLGL